MPADLIEPDMVDVDFSMSALGTLDQNFIAVSNYNNEGVLDIGISKTDEVSYNGSGLLGTLSIVIEDDVAGKSTVVYNFDLGFADVVAIDVNGDTSNYTPIGATFTVEDHLSVSENVMMNYEINPTLVENGLVSLDFEKNITKVEMFDLSGKQVLSKDFDQSQIQLNVSEFQGAYILRVYTEQGVVNQRILIK